ncbi:hypothetical protein DFH28DRAFT_881849 [Melampsora americana]|nr:hypothetical protein DFH28DRAFT_881849 [Melampsora americana]
MVGPQSPSKPSTSKTRPKTSTLTPGSHKYPAFYACYLLRSYQNGRMNQRTYVGSTPDPPRRIRQHNGQIKGGAFRTKYFRPWEMELICYGFPSKLVALQFEWVWNTPYKSRHLQKDIIPPVTAANASHSQSQKAPASSSTKPIKTKGPIFPRSQGSKLEVKLKVLKKMLTTLPWSQFPLQVLFFNEGAYDLWYEQDKKIFDAVKANKNPQYVDPITMIEVSLRVEGVDGARKIRRGLTTDPEDQIKPIDVHDDNAILEDYEKMEDITKRCEGVLKCFLCHETIDIEDSLSYINCSGPDCYISTHLICLSQHFLTSSVTQFPTPTPSANTELAFRKRILPDRGRCPSCLANLRWGDLIKGCYRRKHINCNQLTPSDSESTDEGTLSHSEEENYDDERDEDGSAESQGEDEIATLALGKGVRSTGNRTQARSKNISSKKTIQPLKNKNKNIKPPSKPKPKPDQQIQPQAYPTPNYLSLNDIDDEHLCIFMNNITLKSRSTLTSRTRQDKQKKKFEDEDEPEDEILQLMNGLEISEDSD